MALWSDLAEWVGPTPNQGGGMVEHRGVVLHIAEGGYEGTIAWQRNPAADVSSHFIVAKDGRCAQMVDTAVAAWTQAAGNGHWISVENEGFSGQSLTPQQVEVNARLYARGVREHGWPLESTDSPSGRGLGWHGMGGAAWGGHPECPGEPIKAQRPAILARAAQILTPGKDGMAAVIKRRATGHVYRFDTGWAKHLADDQQVNVALNAEGIDLHDYEDGDFQRTIWNMGLEEFSPADFDRIAAKPGGMLVASWSTSARSTVDVAALAQALLADPGFKAALDKAADKAADEAADEAADQAAPAPAQRAEQE
jgi:N-acetylmuramoyl-L-alanine amidase